MRILIVDDDSVFREELGALLSDDGHSVATSPSVVRAIAELEAAEFDLVLTDLKMPRQGGLELLREVRRRWPRTLVVVVTGYASVETALDAMKSGAFDYVRKPFRIEQVRETLRLAAQEREFESPPGTGRDPIAEARSLAASGRHEVLLFGAPAGTPSSPHLHLADPDPEDPVAVRDRVVAFIGEHPNAAVVIFGVERMLAKHRLEEVAALLDQLRDDLRDHGPLRVGLHPRRVPTPAAVALGSAVAGDETHDTLEALANPIRRKVLERLASGPASFGDAMAAAGLDDSPKMSFHLRRLAEGGLVLHEGDRYRLTSRGEAAVGLLLAATFLPPVSDARNLAFTRSASGAKKGDAHGPHSGSRGSHASD